MRFSAAASTAGLNWHALEKLKPNCLALSQFDAIKPSKIYRSDISFLFDKTDLCLSSKWHLDIFAFYDLNKNHV